MKLIQQTILPRPFRAAALVLGLAAPVTALAAPFCVRNQMLAPQCIYYDASECQRDAQQQGGVCGVNPSEFPLQAGAGQYCLVTSTRASLCVYTDRNTCTADAIRQHGACTDTVQIAPSRAPDPYAANGQ
jgi:hypothetical protein